MRKLVAMMAVALMFGLIKSGVNPWFALMLVESGIAFGWKFFNPIPSVHATVRQR